MMLLADVTKIKCKFVQEMISYLNRRKYSVSPCIKCKYTYYADALKVLYGGVEDDPNFTSDCLDHDDECSLTTKAGSYTIDLCQQATIGCEDQATITIATTEYDCTSTAQTSHDGQFTGSSYPVIKLTNDSIYIDGEININARLSGVCGPTAPYDRATTTVQAGGCTSSGCSNSYLGLYKFGVNSVGTQAATTYVKSMRVYTTDLFGTLSTSYDLDLDPATSPYYVDDITDCPSCSLVVPSEVQIGDPNFSTAFATLMDNVSIALFGAASKHAIAATGGSSYSILCTAKHNPASTWFGFHTPDFRIEMSNGKVYTSANTLSNFSSAIRFYYDDAVFWDPDTWPSSIFLLDCLEHNPIIGDQVSYATIDRPNSSFNKIKLLSPLGNTSIVVTTNVTQACSPTTLTASYTTLDTVSSVSWKDPMDVEISTTDSATVVDPGVYTFTVNLSNGCAVTKTITVT